MPSEITHTISLPGLSSTGTEHGLQIDRFSTGEMRYTVTGRNGKKHAGVTLELAPLKEMADFFAGIAQDRANGYC